jgi:GNAT superfamily N-acetyltransferase
VRRLFETSIDWLKNAGAGTIVGPMDGDTWHSYRLNVGPHDERPFLLEPYNPPYYPELWERNGFEVLERYYSLRVDDLPGVIRRLEPKARKVLDAGYRLERLRVEHFEDELNRFYELSCRIFAHNFLYSEIPRDRFMKLYSGTRGLIDADLVRFAVAPDGTDAGFLFALPDRFRAVAAMKGSKGLVARLRFLTLRNRTDAVNLKSLGVVSEHRRSGLAAALMHCGYRTALDKGYRRTNLCLILDDNPSGKLDAGLGNVLRRYHLYRWCGESEV